MGQRMLKQFGIEVRDPENLPKRIHGSKSALGLGALGLSDLGSGDLAAFAARSILTAFGACTVRDVFGIASRVGAVDKHVSSGLPLRTAVTSVAARHLPLRDCHGYSLLVPDAGSDSGRSVSWFSAAHRGSVTSPCV